MHLDVRRELQGGRTGQDQAAFDLWRNQYNCERPHEALGMKRPAEVYSNSSRGWSGTQEDIDYGAMASRRVQRTGTIRYEGEVIGISVHSRLAFSLPRSMKQRKPMTPLMIPKTGSTVCLRSP